MNAGDYLRVAVGYDPVVRTWNSMQRLAVNIGPSE
jgi:hypothetical protein